MTSLSTTSKNYVEEMRIKDPKLYDLEKLAIKWDSLPSYVRDARSRSDHDSKYDKIVLDKWGRKSGSSNTFVELPEMVFYRAAITAAEGLKLRDPSLNLEEATEFIFNRFVNREVFPNTPYMANSGHYTVSKLYQNRILNDYKINPQVLEIFDEISNLQSQKVRIKGKSELIKEKLNLAFETINQNVQNETRARNIYNTLLELEEEKKQKPQLFACFVLPIYDSKKSIFNTVSDAAEIQKGVGGTGFNFSNLRPANEIIRGSNGLTDGPVSFMAMYSTTLGKTMNQGGKREGANMFMLDADHPDILRFMYSKRQDGEIPAANISVAIDHPFMQALLAANENDHFYPLRNPHYNPDLRPDVPEHYTKAQLEKTLQSQAMNSKAKLSLKLDEDGVTVLSPYKIDLTDNEGNPILNDEDMKVGKIIDGKVYLDARKVMKHLSVGSWYNGEPGVIFTGTINDFNPTHPRHYAESLKNKNPERSLDDILSEINEINEEGRPVNLPIGVGEIRATNPCGEKPLLPYESCVLGHINLEQMLDREDPNISTYKLNKTRLRESTGLMYEILDNAIDQNAFTLSEIEETQKSNRKIGLGFMGLANMLMKLEIPYDSEEGRRIAEEIWTEVESYSDQLSFEKAEKFGSFPNFGVSSLRNGKPKRNAIVRTIAPTGTTGFVAKTTGGLEPEYALTYTRTTVQGTQIKLFNPVLEEKLDKYKIFFNEQEKQEFMDFISDPTKGDGSLQKWEIKPYENESESSVTKRRSNLEKIKSFIKTTYDIVPEDHLLMEAVIQKHTDDAISKTTNFSDKATVQDVQEAFIKAYELGIKGVTFYRNRSRSDQPLEVKGKNEVSLEKKLNTRPETVIGINEKFQTNYDQPGFLIVGFDSETGKPYEAFISVGRAGRDLSALTEGYGRLMSLGFKADVPLNEMAEQLDGIGGETQQGIGPKRVRSLPDSIAKALYKVEEKKDVLFGARKKNKQTSKESSIPKKSNGNGKNSGNLCVNCGKPLIKSESCEKCPDPECGFTKC